MLTAAAEQTALRPVPRDRPFYAIDPYGDVQHVEWCGNQGDPSGPSVSIIDSDGECFPVADIDEWSWDGRTLAEAERLRDALEQILCCHDGNQPDALNNMPDLEYARRTISTIHQIARAALKARVEA